MNTSMLLDTRHSTKVGFLSMFVYGHNIAEQHGGLFQPAVIGDPSDLIGSLAELGLDDTNPIVYSEDSRQQAVDIIEHLFTQNFLNIVSRKMLGCICGKIKIPADAILRKTSTSLMSGDRSICCKSLLEEKEELVLQTNPIEFNPNKIECFPHWGYSEVANMRDNFKGKCLVLSRDRVTGISVSLGGIHFFVDNDMFVYLAPFMDNMNPVNVVAGTSLVKQFTLSSYFMSVLKGRDYNLRVHFLPRVNYKGLKNLKELCQTFGKDRVRRKLLSVAKSEKQVIEFNDSGI